MGPKNLTDFGIFGASYQSSSPNLENLACDSEP